MSDNEDTNIHHTKKVMTRSETSTQQQLKKQEREDDNEIDDTEYFQQLKYQFNNIRNYMTSHKNFIKQIFAHRHDTQVLDLSKHRQYQQDDHLLKIVIRNFKLANKRLNGPDQTADGALHQQ